MKAMAIDWHANACTNKRLKLVMGISVALSMLLAHQTQATHLPQSSKYDARIQYIDYNEEDVVLIQAYPGLGSQVVFASDEKIVDIACGFSQGWEVLDRRNTLYLKPKSIKVTDEQVLLPEAGKWDTNLLIKTNKRFYAFDLYLVQNNENKKTGRPITNPSSTPLTSMTSATLINRTHKTLKKDVQSSSPIQNLSHSPFRRPTYRIQFRYPQEQAKKDSLVSRQQAIQSRLLHEPKVMNKVNAQYSMQVGKNSQHIAPSMAYDDGHFTYFQFPSHRDLPALFILAEDDSEHMVNMHIEPSPSGEEDLLVVHQVASKMVLRSGKAVVSLYNNQFNPHDRVSRHGMSIPGLKRMIRTKDHSERDIHHAL